MKDRAGDRQRLDDWARLFLVPGMDHCSGANGPSDTERQLLLGLVGWVENGRAPDAVIAHRTANGARAARTFLLCREPQTAVYNKAGDVNDAANWTCVSNPARPAAVERRGF